jgi:hypothetical protein
MNARRRLGSFVLAMLAACATVSCDAKKHSTPHVSGSAQLPPLVAEPAGLLVELRIEDPKKLWSGLRQDLGTGAAFFASSVGGLVANSFNLPISLAQEVDEGLPVFALLAKPKATLVGALAIHIKDGVRFSSIAIQSTPQRWRIERKAEAVYLRPKSLSPESTSPLSLAVLGNYLVVASNDRAVEHLGPYMTRNLARAKRGAMLVRGKSKVAAFATLAPRFMKWLRPRLQGLPSMFRTLVRPRTIQALLDTATNTLAGGEFVLRRDEDAMHLDWTWRPRAKAASGFEKIPQQELASLIRLPDDTMAAMAWVESSAWRGRESGALVKRFAARLGIDAAAKEGAATKLRMQLSQALRGLSQGRGDRSVAGVRCTGVGLTGFAKGDVRDKAALQAGARDLSGLTSHPAVQNQLKQLGIELSHTKGRLERVPLDVFRLRIGRSAKSVATKEAYEPIDVRYAISDKLYYLAAGHETVSTLQWLFRAPPKDQTLASMARLQKGMRDAPSKAWFGGFFDLPSVVACAKGKPMNLRPAPGLVSLGIQDGKPRLWLRLDRRLLGFLVKNGAF